MRMLPLALVLGLSLACSSVAAAQTLAGSVADPQGAAVIGAQVRLTGAAPTAPRTTQSSADGTFTFDQVAPGSYTLRIESPGFVTWTGDVTIPADGIRVPVALQVAGFSEDIRVTGEIVDSSLTKSDVPLRDQPMNVSTVTERFIRTFAVNDLVEALANVANVNTYTQYGVYEYYTLRGFSEGAQMVDGIRNEGNRVRTPLFNVERIEVLKGPSSVLSGNEAIGSSVNIVLKKPSARPFYESAVSFGSWNTLRASGGTTGRLGANSVLYRLDIGVEASDNFRHDPWNRLSVTPTVAWQISRDDRLEVRYSLSRNDVSGDGGIPQVTRPDGSIFIPDVARDTRYNTPQDWALSYDHNVRALYTRPLGDHLAFRNVLSPRAFDDEYWVAESLAVVNQTEVTRTFLYFKHKRRPWTNQAEFTSRFSLGVPHNVLGGWDHQNYYSRTTRSNNANITTTRIDLYDPVETHQTHTDFAISRFDHSQNYTEGVYLQDHLELGTRVKAVVLGRADYVDRTTHNNPVANGNETEGTVVTSKQRRISSRYGVVYQPIDRMDLYAQFATSFKPNFNLQPDGSELQPEIGRQWEIGERFRLADSRMHLDASAFHIERRNVALSRPGGFFDQAGMIRSQGLEVELDGQWSSIYFTVGYGYTDAKYVDYVTTNAAGVRTDLSGKTRPRAPHNSFNYHAAKNWSNGITLAVSGRTLGDQFLNDANTLFFDGYSLLSLAASYARGRTMFSLNVGNLTGTEYWASTLGNRQFYPGEPLRVMGTLRFFVE